MPHQKKRELGVTLHRNKAVFQVWAPFAKSVSVCVPYVGHDLSNQRAMTPEGGGYWSVEIEGVEPGQTYRYLIDTGTELLHRNDPRARVLTDSDNGASVIASNDFEWSDKEFTPPPFNQQIIYELHIGTFNRKDASSQGTFYDAIERLDYLKELGVNMIELMPVTSMASSNGWGYNTSDIFSIENSYGGRHGCMEFVNECHKRGIGVIVDVVYNHFLSSTLWQYDGWSENGRGGIYFYNDERGDTPWGSRPDYGRPEVREFILDNVAMWYNEFHIDGMRLDSTIYLRNTEGHNDDPAHDIPDAWTLLQAITTLAHKIKPEAIMIAEDISANSFITKPVSEGGCGFDAQWQLHFPNAIRHAIGVEAKYYADIKTELQHTYNGNAFDKVIFSDSHDTAANGGVRINEAVTPGNSGSVFARQRVLLADAITLTAPGIPLLLQGQEFMQEGAFNDWQELDWDKAEQFAGIVLAHRHLIDLRVDKHGFTAGLTGQSIALFHQDDTNAILGYHRWDKGGVRDDTLVIVNFSDREFDDYLIRLPLGGTWQCRFNSNWHDYGKDFSESSVDARTCRDGNVISVPVKPYGVLIFSQD